MDHEVPPEFRNAVSELLYHAQMVEGLLKAYLADVSEAADEHFRPKGVRFKSPEKELTKATLGRLVRHYGSHSDVDWLFARLSKFVQFRNTAAHTAFLWGFVHGKSPERVSDALSQVREQIKEARILVHAMTIETLRSYELKTGHPLSLAPVEPQ